MHISDHTVSHDEKDLIFLVFLRALFCLGPVIYQLDNWREVSWAIEIDTLNSVFVRLENFIKAVDFRVENVTVQSKAVFSLISIRRNGCSKSKDRDLLVFVIVLKDVADRSNSIQVLVLLHIQVMKTVGLAGVAI